MKVRFGQIYVEPGVSFPFSFLFQHRLSEEISSLISPTPKFIQKYGLDWKIMFRISAKSVIVDTEIRGPSTFKKSKDIEFSIFLPFDAILCDSNSTKLAIEFLLIGVIAVLDSLGIDTSKVRSRQVVLVDALTTDPKMVDTQSSSL